MISIEAIKKLVNDTEHLPGKLFAFTIQLLIVASLVSFTVDTLPDLSKEAKSLLAAVEVVTVSLFTLEYVLRILASEKKIGFIFSFYGLVDLVAILPFYLSTGLDLRAVRIFRLLRLVRILKLFRYNKAAKRFQRAFVIAKEELI